jgi:CHAT domain-containing protein/tetratricopeptide (TPR) repeat protein
MTFIFDKRGVRLFVLLAVIVALQVELKYQSRGQEVSALPASRESQIEEGRKLSLEVEELVGRGKFDEALLKATRALEIREKVFGPEQPEVAPALGSAAYIFFRKKNHAKARELYERALAIQKKAGLENQETVRLLNDFGLLYYEEGDHNGAEQLYRRSLAMQQKIPWWSENPKAANIMFNLAVILLEKEDYEAARQLYRSALTIQEEVYGPESPKLILTLNYLAVAHLKMGASVEARGLFNRAAGLLDKNPQDDVPEGLLVISNLMMMSLREGNLVQAESLAPRILALLRRNPIDHPEYKAVGYSALGQLQKLKGDRKKAEQYYVRSSELLEQASLMKTAFAAEVLTDLGSLYVEQGDYASARDRLERAKAIRKDVLGTGHMNYATSLSLLADLDYRQGNYREAETTYKQALEIYRKTPGEMHPYTATVINNLGMISLIRGSAQEAEALFQKALDIREKVLPPTHEDIAASLTPLAQRYIVTGRLDKAAAALQRARAIYEQARGPDDPLVARTINDLGLVHHEKGEPRQAEELFRLALTINRKRFGEVHLDLTPSLNNLALAQESLGNPQEAERLYRQAVGMYDKLRVPRHPDLAKILNNYSAFASSQGDMDRAVRLAERATEIEEHYLALMLAEGSESQNHAYWQTLLDSTARTISFHTRDAPNYKPAVRLALTTVLRRKGRVLDAMTDSIQALRADPSPAKRKLLDEFEAARARLAAAISGSLGGADDGNAPAAVARLEEDYQRLESQVIGAEAGSRAPSRPVTIESIQRLIPPGAALVELVVYKPFNLKAREPGQKREPNHYVAYVLRRDGDVRWVELGEAGDIHCLLWDLRAALRHPAVYPEGKDIKDIKELAREVDEWVMRPIRKLLGGARRLLISPDLLFQLIPFEALRDERGRYLVETYSFTYLNSARDLQRLQSRAPSRQPPVIIANPDFNMGTGEAAPSPPAQTAFIPLPETEEEARQIQKLLPGARIMKGPEATALAVKRMRGPSILHVATHGFFTSPRDPNPEVTKVEGVQIFRPCIQLLSLEYQYRRSANYQLLLSQSGIALAGANRRAGVDGEDGILTAFEVGGLDLRGTKLVVLSACESAIGDVYSGDGVYGLRRALSLAGAESQVISLWKVNDEATRDLMVKFYAGLRAGRGRSQALREAKLAMMRDGVFGHPYFWASFIGSGDWRSLGNR